MLVMPSIKANFALALRRILTEEGTGCDTFGAGELDAALRTGVAPERISLNGSTKNRELIERAVAAGVRLTLDSVAELETVREVARVAGRGRPGEAAARGPGWKSSSRPSCSPNRSRFSSQPSVTSPGSRPSSCWRSRGRRSRRRRSTSAG